MSYTPTTSQNDDMLAGIGPGLDDDPTNHAYAILFDSSNVALVTLFFAKPAGALAAHQFVFAQADLTGDMIGVQGNAANFKLYSGTGVLKGSGDVTDALGTGAMKISGTTGTLLYAGARAILHSLKFT